MDDTPRTKKGESPHHLQKSKQLAVDALSIFKYHTIWDQRSQEDLQLLTRFPGDGPL